MSFALLFRRDLPFGAVVAVSLPAAALGDHDMPPTLHPEEAAFARGLAPARRAGWVGGRVALRTALRPLAAAGELDHPIRATPRGAPALPPGLVGSISHKRELALALAARATGQPPACVGIDVEPALPLRTDISSRVLGETELAALAGLEGLARDVEVLRRFAAKEAIYKALDPWVRRWVGFHEAVVDRAWDGRLTARLSLAQGEGPFSVELHDASDDQLIIVAARIAPAGAPAGR